MELFVAFVEPQFTGNIGFLARTMANFSLKNLILVNPPPLDKDVYRFAKHAKYIVDNAIIMKSFDELREFLDYAVATSGVSTASPKKFKRISLTPREFASRLPSLSGKVGIIFGRENYGLFNEEIERCDLLVKVPTSEEYPIMNITHAAAVIFYEIYLKMRENQEIEEKQVAESLELDLLNSRFSTILDIINFPEHKKKNTEVMFRRIMGRAVLTKWEYHSMMGVFRRIIYTLENLSCVNQEKMGENQEKRTGMIEKENK